MFIGTSRSEEKSNICASYASIDGEVDIIAISGEMHRVGKQEKSAFALHFVADLGQAWSVQITCYDTPHQLVDVDSDGDITSRWLLKVRTRRTWSFLCAGP